MRRLVILCAAAALAGTLAPAAAGDDVLCRKHITLMGPWTLIRSMTVLNDQDDVDGFFCLPLPGEGSTLAARVVENRNGLPYSLAMNFHSDERCGPRKARCWKGGCPASLAGSLLGEGDITCGVPAEATTVEVTGIYGADADVEVVTVSRPG